MKKEKQRVLLEIVEPFNRSNDAVIRKTAEDGSVSYHLTDIGGGIGGKIETYDDEVDMTLMCSFERLEELTNLLNLNGEYTEISIIYAALIEKMKLEIEEMFEFIYDEIGRIKCTWTRRNQRCVGAFIEPFHNNRKGKIIHKLTV